MFKNDILTSLCILFAYIYLFTSTTLAQGIYKSTDEKGRTHYSSKPINSKSQQAKLPEITRGEVKVPASQLISCRSHGGVNCEAGIDADGSVICNDGFRDAAQRFRFTCNAAKLEVTQISDPSSDGSFTIVVRNSKSVAAIDTEVKVRFPDGSAPSIPGPKEIEGFGVAEFKYGGHRNNNETLPNQISLSGPIKVGIESIDVTCRNCPS